MHLRSYYDAVLAMEMKKKSKSIFNYDTNLTSKITVELKFDFSLRCWFLRMTSLVMKSSTLKNSLKF